jgi:3-deoxy-D-manno-octulosonate 8-phosphate phosphatase (KDO 8-P phosphatase)
MKLSSSALISRARKIKIIGMDVDGVLTGGEIIVLESGEEIKFWNAQDRLGLALLRDRKVPLIIAWITGRQSNAVQWAARDLGVSHVVQKCHDKKKAFQTILDEHKFSFEEAAFIGDDLIDLQVLHAVGFSACPKDAVPDVKKRVHYISPLNGGRGVVRDVCEFILRAQKKWDPLVNSLLS